MLSSAGMHDQVRGTGAEDGAGSENIRDQYKMKLDAEISTTVQSALIGVFATELAFTHVPHDSGAEGWNSATMVILRRRVTDARPLP